MSKLPFLKLLIPFALGIFTSIYWHLDWQITLAVTLLMLVVAWFVEHLNNRQLNPMPYKFLSVVLFISSFSLGYLRLETFKDVNRNQHFTNHDAEYLEVLVNDVVEQKFNNYRFKGKVLSLSDSTSIHSATGNILVYWDTSLNIRPEFGKSYWLNLTKLNIPRPKNPYEFNYKEYLTYYNIYYKAYIKEEAQVATSHRKRTLLSSIVANIRTHSKEVLNKYLPDKSAYLVAQALILGGKNNLDEKTKSYFSQTGTLHVLAVSGLHVGIVFLVLGLITKSILRIRYGKYFRVLIVLIGIWMYALVTGFSPSVQRASIMFTVFGVAELIKGKTMGLNSLFASAFIMLAINPFLIVNVGFQLSYAAVLGILLIYPPLYQLFAFSWIRYKPIHFVVDKAWSIVAISIAAQAATFPISIFYFGQFPSYFMFSNLVIIPLVFVLVCLAISILVLSPIAMLAKALAFVFSHIAHFILYAVEAVSHLPFSFASGLHLTFLQVILLYIILAFLVIYLHRKKVKWLNLALLGLVGFLCVINLNYIHASKQSAIVVHSIKKQDVVSIIHGKRAYVLADSGFINNKSAQKFHLAPYFRNNYIQQVNYETLKGKLAGVISKSDSVRLLTYRTPYPNTQKLLKLKAPHLLVLHRNSFTDTLFNQNYRVIWKSNIKKWKNVKSHFHSLDSFAFNF